MEPHSLDDAGTSPWRTRRNFLRTGLLGGALTVVLAACGGTKQAMQAVSTTTKNTASTAGSATSTGAGAAGSITTAPAPSSSATSAPTTTAAPATTTTAAATTTTAATPARAIAANQELVVSYSYVASGGGRIHNPYMAVWIEDQHGRSLRTIHLSLQPGKGSRWYPDLKRWYRADQARLGEGGVDLISTISGATRLPGDVSVAWDGLDDAGAPLPSGTYVLYIEAARERGPYQIVSQELALTGQPLSAMPAAEGDLQNVVVQLRSRQ